MRRKRLTDLRPDEPLFPENAPPARPRFVQARAAQCAVCDNPTTAVAASPALCTWCATNPCAALDILEAQMVACEEKLAAAWAPLEKVMARASEAEKLRYCELWNKRAAAHDDPAELEKLERGVWLARSSERRREAPGLAKILDTEAGVWPGILAQHTVIHAEMEQIRAAQSALLSFRHKTKDWRIPDDLSARRARIPRWERPAPVVNLEAA
ncbi:MAG TPA: hypothetical protein VGE07_24100 [Herpetosiphonaceae bacterium]